MNFNNNNIYNTQGIINELNTAVNAVLSGQVKDIFYVKKTIDRMIKEGKIREVGGGTNRITIELLSDHTQLKNELQIPSNIVIKVPVKLPEGLKDNLRAGYVWRSVLNSGLDNSVEMNYIRKTILPSVVIPGTSLLAQERVIRIEDSEWVRSKMRSGEYRPDQIVKACRDYIMGDSKIYADYHNIISAMDLYFVLADLNVEFSSLNFGFKYVDGVLRLTILDYGYVEWKSKPNVCPKCGRPLRYVIPGESFLDDNRNKAIATNIQTFGLYSCKSFQCNFNPGTGISTSYFEKDIATFMKYIS